MASAVRALGTGAVLMAARLVGAALTFGTQVLVSRMLGADALGAFLLLVAAIGIAGVVLPLGFHALAPYLVAEYDTDAGRNLQRGFVATAYGTLALSSLVALVVAVALAVSGIGALEPRSIALVTAGAVVTAVMAIGAGVALGLQRPYLAMIPDMIVKPAGLLVGALVLVAAGRLSPMALVASFVAIVSVAACVQGTGLLRVLRERDLFTGRPSFAQRRWWSFAPAWLLIVLIAEYTIDVDLLLLATWLSAEQIGILGATMRVFVLGGFALTAVYAVALPGVFAAGRNEGDAALTDAIARANLAATLVAVCCLAGAAIGGPLLLAVFGPKFVAGQPALLILTASLVVRAVFGPASVVLSIFDRPYASVAALVAGLGLLFGLNALWVPTWGITGAAVSLSAVMSFWSVCQWLVTWRLTGRNIALRPGDLRLATALLKGRG